MSGETFLIYSFTCVSHYDGYGCSIPTFISRFRFMAQTVKNLPEVPDSIMKIPWRREWLLTPVFLPGEFY